VLDLSEALVRAPEPPRGSAGGPVAVFDSCHLLHAQGVREAPRELLRGAGYEPVELERAGRCCGAAGVYAFTQPELSQQLARDRVEAIRASGAAVVSCGNPGCALQLRSGLREAGLDVRVAHPAELVAEATRGA
jgi:glycolate oxidase iron-sulfur subunit